MLRHLAWAAHAVTKYGLPRRVLYFGMSPGDDVLLSAVLEGCAAVHGGAWSVCTRFPDLFRQNPHVAQILPADMRFALLAQRLSRTGYVLRYPTLDLSRDQTWPLPKEHLIVSMCRSAKLYGRMKILPRVYLPSEHSPRVMEDDYVVFHSSGTSARMPMITKEWFPDRLARVVSAAVGGLKFVQVGSPSDPRIHGTLDLRGKTSIAATARIIAEARLFLGQVGFLMHLARAVDTPSVIIYGGREAPWQSGYSANINLYSPVACAPCWYWNHCPHDRICMQQITSDDVLNAIDRQMSVDRHRLPVDVADLDANPAVQSVQPPEV